MKKIVLLAFVLVLLSTAVVVRTSTTLNVTSLGANPEGMAGVKAGDWAKYDVIATWDSNDSQWQPPPSWADLNNTEYYIISVQMVSGTNITFQTLIHFKNGTEQTTTAWMDIITGYGSGGGYYNVFIPANLSAGDTIHLGKINGTISCMYVGVIRDTNHLHRTSEVSFNGDPNSYNASENYYWDKAIGFQTEYAGNYSSQTASYYYFLSVSFKIIHTNLWGLPVHNIDTGLDYSTIQEAIDANETLGGHVISVDAGTYYENVVLNKSLALIGEDRDTTIIDGNGTGTVINVTANNTVIGGFTIQYSGSEEGVDSGICVDNSFNCSVFNNNVKNSWFGILLSYSSNCSVSDNNANNNELGIGLALSSNNVLRNNTMVGNSYNFFVIGESLQDYIQDIDVSNTVDGKPVYYLVNQNNLTVNPSTHPSIGYLALVNSTKTIVEDLTLTNNGQGVLLAYTTNSTIRNITVSNDGYGIMLFYSSYCSLSGNYVRNNNNYGIVISYSSSCSVSENNVDNNQYYGIILSYSSNCSISCNNVTHSDEGGIRLVYCSNCSVSGNNINNNWGGIDLDDSSSNKIYHNNFINNTHHVSIYNSLNNTWDDGYPSGGNYWSDYTGDDTNHDGIGDSWWYVIYQNNIDHYPLMGMFSDFNATSEHRVQTICNSSISDFQFNGTAICFNVAGEDVTAGFCRICIPTALMNDAFRVFVNGTEILPSPEPLPCSNSTHNYLYFTYDHSTQEVVIVPEFPNWTSILLMLIVLTVAIAIYKRRLVKTPIH